ncbi:MAG: hypothetical protein KDK97_02115 [Verrucomicrobiales bacterium]|nr:hypothetical protein [Verrucomicrobiales bacterium]
MKTIHPHLAFCLLGIGLASSSFLHAAEDYPASNAPASVADYIRASREELKEIGAQLREADGASVKNISDRCGRIQDRLQDLAEKQKSSAGQALIDSKWLTSEIATWGRIAALTPMMADTAVRMKDASETTQTMIEIGGHKLVALESSYPKISRGLEEFRRKGEQVNSLMDDINDDAELLLKALAKARSMQESLSLLDALQAKIAEAEEVLTTGFEASGSNVMAGVKLFTALAKEVNEEAMNAHEAAAKEYEALLKARAIVTDEKKNPDLDRKGQFHDAWKAWVAALDKHGDVYRKQADRMEREFTTSQEKVKKTLAFTADKVISFGSGGVFKLDDIPLGGEWKNRLERGVTSARSFIQLARKKAYEAYDKVSRTRNSEMREFVRGHHNKILGLILEWERDSRRLTERAKARMDAIHTQQKAVDQRIMDAEVDLTGYGVDAAHVKQVQILLSSLRVEDEKLLREEAAERSHLEEMEKQLVSVFTKKLDDAERDFRVGKAIEITKAIAIAEKEGGERATMAKSLKAEAKALSDAMDKFELQLGSYDIQP